MSDTQITDTDAFAVCVARGVEHPAFQDRLHRPHHAGAKMPGPLELPIRSLLGSAGHLYCDGYRLDPVGGSLEAAVANRLAWSQGRRDVPTPTAKRLTSADFDGATIIFTFAPRKTPGGAVGDGWKLANLYPDPDSHAEPAMPRRYWQDNPEAPFAVLLDVVETYCHPEAYDEAYDDLKALVHLPERDPIFDRFEQQLAEAIRGPGRIPDGALFRAAVYDDGSAAMFLARLWRDLYPDEPAPDEAVPDGSEREDRA